MANQGRKETIAYDNRIIATDNESKSQFFQLSITIDKIKNEDNNNNCINELLGTNDLVNTRELSLRSRQLTNLPNNFAVHLPNITILDLSNNKLEDLPSSLKLLSKLQILILDDNWIQSLPVAITAFVNLKVLQLSRNRIVKLPVNFGDVRSLETLVLSFNKLTELPTSCKTMNILKYLDLSGNSFESMPQCILKGMKNLETLNLSYNICINISSRPASNKLKAFHAKEIGHRLKFPSWILTGHAPSLEVLQLDGTTFKNFEFPLKCSSLRIKSLSFKRCCFYDSFVNKLTSLTSELEILRAGNENMENGGNFFWSIPIEDLAKPQLMTEIDVRSSGLWGICRRIGDFENLVYLDFGGNHVSWMPDEICRLTKLEILVADRNELSSLPDNIGLMSSLKELRVNTNHLAELPESFGQLKNLTHLDLYENEFYDVPKILENMEHLVGLDLDRNSFNIEDCRFGQTDYQALREKLRTRYESFGYIRETGPRYERDYEEQSDESSDKSSIACDDDLKDNPDNESVENWDISDDSADEFDPTRDDNPHSTKKPLPNYNYAEMMESTLQFCPADLHKLPVRQQVQQMREQGLIKECPAIVDGQFDDAADDDSSWPF